MHLNLISLAFRNRNVRFDANIILFLHHLLDNCVVLVLDLRSSKQALYPSELMINPTELLPTSDELLIQNDNNSAKG